MPRVIGLRFRGYGKAPRCGRDVWKFDAGAARLIAAGWRLVRQTDSYLFLSPPPGVVGTKCPVIRVTVPARSAVVEAMRAAHVARVRFRGEMDGWPVEYSPREAHIQEEEVWRVGEAPSPEMYAAISPAVSRIGEPGVWSEGWIWDLGDDDAPREISGVGAVAAAPADQLFMLTD